MTVRKKLLLVVAALVAFFLLLQVNNSLTTYQAVAIWLEGIALALIFVWDRFDARNQIEATHRPFVSYTSIARDALEARADIDTNATTVIHCPEAQAQIKNYGSGPAINIRYSLVPTKPKSSILRPKGYLAALRPDVEFTTPIARATLEGNEWETVITYESLSGRKYQTKIISNNLVMTKISVTQL